MSLNHHALIGKIVAVHRPREHNLGWKLCVVCHLVRPGASLETETDFLRYQILSAQNFSGNVGGTTEGFLSSLSFLGVEGFFMPRHQNGVARIYERTTVPNP